MLLAQVKNVRKAFPGVQALDDVSVEFHSGEVHALVGENGAGKSTLIKLLCGVYQPDSGLVYVGNKKVSFKSTRESMEAGVSAVYQELVLVSMLSVLDNLFLGMEPTKLIFIDKKAQRKRCAELLQIVGGENIDMNMKVCFLSSAQQQLVCIAKALAFNSKVLILDEVTATLTDVECEHLFNLINRLKDDGHCIIYISHRMKEIQNISDVTTIMKDGKVVKSRLATKDYSIEQIVNMMIGRELKEYYPYRSVVESKDPYFVVSDLTSERFREAIAFNAYPGEILGFSGLVGSGRTEMAKAIFGIDKKISGSISVGGKKLNIKSPRDAIRSKIIYLPEERRRSGLFLKHSIALNITISNIKKILNSLGLIESKEENEVCSGLSKEIAIKATGVKSKVAVLSGGNQQKVLLARSVFTDSEIIILDEPTRGIDVGAKTEIYNLIKNYAEQGKCFIVISSDVMELLGICHRIMVMRNNRIVGELPIEVASEKMLTDMALGTI